MNCTIFIDENEIKIIKEFATKFGKAEKTLSNFGSYGKEITRNEVKQYINTVNGKIGESAFKKFSQISFNEEIEIDFEIWEGHDNCDGGQDIKLIGGIPAPAIVDIKQSKHIAQWLAVEKHKIDGTVSSADAFILITTKNECKFNDKTEQIEWPREVECHIEGFAFKEDFYDQENIPFFKFCEGEQLYSNIFIEKTLSHLDYIFSSHNLQKALCFTKENWDCTNKIYMNVTLDAKVNIGLPKFLLRKSESDFINFFKYLHGKKSHYERLQIVAKK